MLCYAVLHVQRGLQAVLSCTNPLAAGQPQTACRKSDSADGSHLVPAITLSVWPCLCLEAQRKFVV